MARVDRVFLLRLNWPDKALSPHAKGHWRPKSQATKAAREEAWAEAKNRGVVSMPEATIIFKYYPPDKRRRDAHNLPAMLKPHIDGIADAMGCDDHKFKCVFPSEFEGPIKGGCILAEVREATITEGGE